MATLWLTCRDHRASLGSPAPPSCPNMVTSAAHKTKMVTAITPNFSSCAMSPLTKKLLIGRFWTVKWSQYGLTLPAASRFSADSLSFNSSVELWVSTEFLSSQGSYFTTHTIQHLRRRPHIFSTAAVFIVFAGADKRRDDTHQTHRATAAFSLKKKMTSLSPPQ